MILAELRSNQMIDKTQLTNEDKEIIIAEALDTEEGRTALA